MPSKAPQHDLGEEIENDTRRDDHLEREFGSSSRDFVRGSDRNDVLFSEYLSDRKTANAQSAELFNTRQKARDAQAAVTSREDEAYAGLMFRDAAIHSTAVGSLEGETATVGDEEQENVPDEEHPDSSAQK